MDNLGPLKTQIMTMFMMKKDSKEDDIFNVVYTMLFMNFIEYVFKHLPTLTNSLKAFALTYLIKKKNEITPLVIKNVVPSNPKKKEEVIYSMTLQRPFYKNGSSKSTPNNDNIEKIDAVIDYLCKLSNVKNVKMGTRYSLNTVEELELTPLLKAKVQQSGSIDGDDDGLIEILIYSTVLNIPGIREWIEEVYNNYVYEKNNKLGNSIYYFNEIPVDAPYGINPDTKEKEYRLDNSPKMLMFRMTEFKTSKSFTNVYGNHVSELKERLDLFINHPEWYIERGIPHSIGILLHGVPGGGKTSTIKAISKDTNRHIFNLSLRDHTTQQQLTNLFFNDTVNIMVEGNKQTLKIPLNKRIYVIEDIDCLTDVVLDRELYPQNNKKGSEAITLSFLLNLLDGVLETPGRILVITSNYPERLDKAFIRPGRIDVKIEFTYTNRPFILDMVNKFYTTSLTLEDIPEELDNVFTPAEVMECLCTYFKEPLKSIEYMKEKKVLKEKYEAERKKMLDVHKLDNDSSTTISDDTVIIEKDYSSNSSNSSRESKNIETVIVSDDEYFFGYNLTDNEIGDTLLTIKDDDLNKLGLNMAKLLENTTDKDKIKKINHVLGRIAYEIEQREKSKIKNNVLEAILDESEMFIDKLVESFKILSDDDIKNKLKTLTDDEIVKLRKKFRITLHTTTDIKLKSKAEHILDIMRFEKLEKEDEKANRPPLKLDKHIEPAKPTNKDDPFQTLKSTLKDHTKEGFDSNDNYASLDDAFAGANFSSFSEAY